ncbi:hypothetical protein BCR34DRAFT_598711 [Clohesyomyces aquaticus]|uniref:Hypervirulence associated protein TUDOR domain-containing protein n=1 Tax=Clohesyomyces aquaticus TaxID=1231657 RepID=A0A1Y1ZXR6_9PLEO|nr:hypothetical protein BCR34DRAFT_598711 [Clohesyomyces aquaticus]
MPSKVKEETGQKNDAGKQYVETTRKTEQEKRSASKDEKQSAKDCTTHWEDAVHVDNGNKEYLKFKDAENKAEDVDMKDAEDSGQQSSRTGSTHEDGDSGRQANSKKRGRGAHHNDGSKKQKSSSKDEPQGIAGDKTRVPKAGQQVQWKTIAGFVDGEVVEVVYEEKSVDGKKVKASKEDPRIVLKSSSSGKTAVHKPEAVYFD